MEDYDIEFNLRKHKDELEYRKEMEMAEKNLKLTKIGIILPIFGVFVTAICCTLIDVYRQNFTNALRFQKSYVVTKINDMKPNDKMKLPKLKMNDFHTLLNMGFDKKDVERQLSLIFILQSQCHFLHVIL